MDAPSRPGIFGVDVKPARAGARELVIALKSAVAHDDASAVPDVTVYPDQQAARKAVESAPEEAEGISFLKEQQWALDFGTVVAEKRAIRESIRVPAEIVARPGGAAQVVAPVDGRLDSGGPGRAGQCGDAGTGARAPAAAAVGSRRAAAARTGARRSRRLRRSRDSRSRARRAAGRGRRVAAEARSTKHARSKRRRWRGGALPKRRSRNTTPRESAPAPAARADSSSFARPIAGAIASRQATTGANVAAGTTLFEVADVSQVHVAGRVPESQAAQALRTTAAEIEVAGRDAVPIQGRATTLGKVLDPRDAHIADRVRGRQPRIEAAARAVRVSPAADGRDRAANGDTGICGDR